MGLFSWWVWWFLLGVLGRVFVPYAVRWVDTGEPFRWRMVFGQLVAALIAVGPLWWVLLLIGQPLDWTPLVALGMGWFISDFGRELQKLAEIAFHKGMGQ